MEIIYLSIIFRLFDGHISLINDKRYVYCSCLILEWCANLEAIVVKFEKSINKESSLRLKGNVSVISSDHLFKKLHNLFSCIKLYKQLNFDDLMKTLKEFHKLTSSTIVINL